MKLYLQLLYDFMGRRYSKKAYTYDTQVSDFTLQVSSSFLYNGWDMIHETTTPQSPALPVTRSYVWGLDLSQTLQGAGGVGGLLCSVHTPQSGSAATYYATADANGNITDYVNETGAVSASFTYDTFGQVVTESIAQGLEPNAFPHRFSSKYQDLETDLNYYGYRYYSAEMGRWLNRDPIAERGGINIYCFVLNSPYEYYDHRGTAVGDMDDHGKKGCRGASMATGCSAGIDPRRVEYCGAICKHTVTGKRYRTPMVSGGWKGGRPYCPVRKIAQCKKCYEVEAIFHSHPKIKGTDRYYVVSPEDKALAKTGGYYFGNVVGGITVYAGRGTSTIDRVNPDGTVDYDITNSGD